MTPVLGIDASLYQGRAGVSVQRFNRLHGNDIRFGIFRATIGQTVDPSCVLNVRRAEARRWVVGTYHYLYPGRGPDQADAYMALAPAAPMLCALDVEQDGISWADVQGFVGRFREVHPHRPIGCYTSEGAWRRLTGNADGEALFDWLWQARWVHLGTNEQRGLPPAPPPTGFGGWKGTRLWQYGTFDDRGRHIDGDAWYGPIDELRALGVVERPPIEERPRYRRGFDAMLGVIQAGAATDPSPTQETGAAWDKGVQDARTAVTKALSDVRVVP